MARFASILPFRASPARRGGVLARTLALLALRRSRRGLAGLDAARLRDVGLTREQALLESCRPFWDAPDHWLR